MLKSKTIIRKLFLILFLSTIPFLVHADNCNKELKNYVEKMYSYENTDSLKQISKKIIDLKNQCDNKWYTYYYAAFSLIRIAFFEKESNVIDDNLDVAQIYLEKLKEMKDKKCEALVLQALLYSMRITKPSRGIKYSVLSNSALDEAQELNSKNPRIYYCRGNNLFHTPEFFGGGKAKALKQFLIAKDLFESYELKNELDPNWDATHNNTMILKCEKEI